MTAYNNIRNSKLDNTKYYLMILVIFAHFIASYKEQIIYGYLLKIIFVFHMPLFILISGYLSRLDDENYYKKILSYLIIPYILLDTYYTFFDYFLYEKENIKFMYTYPNYALWFLLSLATWKLLLPMVMQLPNYVTFFFIIGLISGFASDIGTKMSLARTIYFFPFFLIGYWARSYEQIIDFLMKNKLYFFIPTFFIITSIFFIDFDYNLLFGVKNYYNMQFSPWAGFIVRGAIYASSIILSCSFLIIIPGKVHFATRLGKATFLIYVYHIAFILMFRGAGGANYLKKYVTEYPLSFLLLFALTSFLITFIIGNTRNSLFLRNLIVPDFLLHLLGMPGSMKNKQACQQRPPVH